MCLITPFKVYKLTGRELTGYPDGHPDHDVDEEAELEHLKAKVDAGADYIITQLFYDVDGFLDWVKRVRAKGEMSYLCGTRINMFLIGINVPIIPGIMPMQSYASFLRVTKLCGTRIPPQIIADLEPIKASLSPVVLARYLTRLHIAR